MPEPIDYYQSRRFVYTEDSQMSNRFALMEWSREERLSWRTLIGVSERTVNEWCRLSGNNIVPSFGLTFLTRLEIMPAYSKRNYQFRFIAGLMATGYITRLPRFEGIPRTYKIPVDYYSHGCGIIWAILTHQETDWFLGLSFTRIELNKLPDSGWEIVVQYNDFVYDSEDDSPFELDNDGSETLEEYFDREIPETS